MASMCGGGGDSRERQHRVARSGAGVLIAVHRSNDARRSRRHLSRHEAKQHYMRPSHLNVEPATDETIFHNCRDAFRVQGGDVRDWAGIASCARHAALRRP